MGIMFDHQLWSTYLHEFRVNARNAGAEHDDLAMMLHEAEGEEQIAALADHELLKQQRKRVKRD